MIKLLNVLKGLKYKQFRFGENNYYVVIDRMTEEVSILATQSSMIGAKYFDKTELVNALKEFRVKKTILNDSCCNLSKLSNKQLYIASIFFDEISKTRELCVDKSVPCVFNGEFFIGTNANGNYFVRFDISNEDADDLCGILECLHD